MVKEEKELNRTDRFYRMYQDGTDMIDKAEQLVAGGWPVKDVYAMVWEQGDLEILRYRVKPDVKLAEGTWRDYFEWFISGEHHVRKSMGLQNFLSAELEKVYEKVENGELFLYADQGQLDIYFKEHLEVKNAASEPIMTTDGYGAPGVIDPTPGAFDLENEDYPREGDHRVGLDGQNIRRVGDRVPDPDAETGFDPAYYKLGRDGARISHDEQRLDER